MAGITNVTHYPNAVPASRAMIVRPLDVSVRRRNGSLLHHRRRSSGGGAAPHAALGAVQGGQLNEILRIEGLTVRYGAVTALDGLDLTVRRGELFVLLGGSGSGKTTLLRAVGGFVAARRGLDHLDGVDFAGVPPHRRPVNTVFQSGALFPHLSVAANIGFGPRQRGMTRAAIDGEGGRIAGPGAAGGLRRAPAA